MKQIAYESKYVDSRLPALLVEQFMLSWRAPAEYANTAQLRLEGFKGVLEGRSNGLDFLLKKGKMEFYLEFMCMVKTGKEQRIMTDSLDELTQFYVALVKQQFYEESDEQAKKCNLLLSLRKYFVSSIKQNIVISEEFLKTGRTLASEIFIQNSVFIVRTPSGEF